MQNILFNGKGYMIFTWRNLFLFNVIIFHRCFCLLIFLTHVFLHCLRLSKNSRAHNDVLYATNCATFSKEMLVLKSAIQEGFGTSWFCPKLIGGQGVYLPPSSDPRTQAKLWLYLVLGENKFWFYIAPKWLPQVTSFPTNRSPGTMQYLGSV